jgi:hypothetical protein
MIDGGLDPVDQRDPIVSILMVVVRAVFHIGTSVSPMAMSMSLIRVIGVWIRTTSV